MLDNALCCVQLELINTFTHRIALLEKLERLWSGEGEEKYWIFNLVSSFVCWMTAEDGPLDVGMAFWLSLDILFPFDIKPYLSISLTSFHLFLS